jgi:hypothetical protein
MRFGFAIVLASLSWQTAVEQYRAAVAAIGRGGPVERAFERAIDVRSELLGRLESLPESEFVRLQSELPGLIINREEVQIVAPKPAFFLDLARVHGRAADVAFFEELQRTYPDSVWPSYVRQVTDITSCTDFGSGELTARYAAWLRYRRAHHRAYRAEVDRQLAEIEQHAAQGTCACGDAATVAKELRAFARRFPRSRVHTRVAKRVEALRAGRSDIRFHCSPN